MRKKAIVVGLGNTGRCALKAIKESSDFECIGIIRRAAEAEFYDGVRQYASDEELPVRPDVAILCIPSKNMPETAERYLRKGINVVDSFDIHGDIAQTIEKLSPVAAKFDKAAVISAGWDPGSDSAVRAIFKALHPAAQIYTSFGPGMSMGHSVVARGVRGVADAVSVTLPLGMGKHKRLVYVKPDGTQTKEEIYNNMKADDYFAHDPLEIEIVADVSTYKNSGHGGLIEMTEGETKAEFKMTVNNPETTARVMLAAARAALRMPPGAYTLIDIPLVKMLEGDRIENIKKLV
ncbi:meso-diaminopimelate D-dehydrogenase [Bacteroidia bacterium]|nr:meso-diaminopimelate D-dehydrogenase [Bacteroidia bacterium]